MQKNGIRYPDPFPVSREDYLLALQTTQKGTTACRKHNDKVLGLTVCFDIFHYFVSSTPSAKNGIVPKTRHIQAVHNILQNSFAFQSYTTVFPQPFR
jgi:hypothetical protein